MKKTVLRILKNNRGATMIMALALLAVVSVVSFVVISFSGTTGQTTLRESKVVSPNGGLTVEGFKDEYSVMYGKSLSFNGLTVTGTKDGKEFTSDEYRITYEAQEIKALGLLGESQSVEELGNLVVTKNGYKVTWTVKVTGYDEANGEFNLVVQPSTDGLKVTLNQTSYTYTYNGKSQMPASPVTVTANGTPVTDTAKITSTITKNGANVDEVIDAGTYTVTVTASVDNFESKTSEPYTIVVNKQTLTITGESGSREYNGAEQTLNGITYEGLAEGQSASKTALTYEAKATNVGDAGTGVFSGTAQVMSGHTDVTANYDIQTPVVGKLTITPIEATVTVTITGKNDTQTYDGQPHSLSFDKPSGYYTVSADHRLYDVSNVSLKAGKSISSISQTEAGTKYLGLTSDMFENTSNNFANVSFQVTDGYVKVNPYSEAVTVTITGASNTVTYDGELHSVSFKYESSVDSYTEADFTYDDDAFNACKTLSETNAKSTAYTKTLDKSKFKNTNANYEKVTFEVKGNLSLTINKRPIVIRGTNNEDTYNGSEKKLTANGTLTLTGPDKTAVDGNADSGLISGHTLTVSYQATGTDAGTYNGVFGNDCAITSGTTNVTSNYSVSSMPGTLTIDPKPVTVSIIASTYTYSPEASKAWTNFVTVSGLCGTDTIEYTKKLELNKGVLQNNEEIDLSSAKILDAGDYVVTISGDVNQGNYTVNADGDKKTFSATEKFTVNKADLTLTVPDGLNYEGVYNGQPQKGNGEPTVEDKNGNTVADALWYSTDEGKTWDSWDSQNPPTRTAAGKTTVWLKAEKDNYTTVEYESGSERYQYSIEINKRPIVIRGTDKTYTYDGSEKKLTADGTLTLTGPDKTAVDGNAKSGLLSGHELTVTYGIAKTDAGTYGGEFKKNSLSIVDTNNGNADVKDNYDFSAETSWVPGTLTINKSKELTVKIKPGVALEKTYTGETYTLTEDDFVVTGVNGTELNKNEYTLSFSYDGGDNFVSDYPSCTSGSQAFIVKAESDNYEDATESYTLTVSGGQLELAMKSDTTTSWTYDGAEHKLTDENFNVTCGSTAVDGAALQFETSTNGTSWTPVTACPSVRNVSDGTVHVRVKATKEGFNDSNEVTFDLNVTACTVTVSFTTDADHLELWELGSLIKSETPAAALTSDAEAIDYRVKFVKSGSSPVYVNKASLSSPAGLETGNYTVTVEAKEGASGNYTYAASPTSKQLLITNSMVAAEQLFETAIKDKFEYKAGGEVKNNSVTLVSSDESVGDLEGPYEDSEGTPKYYGYYEVTGNFDDDNCDETYYYRVDLGKDLEADATSSLTPNNSYAEWIRDAYLKGTTQTKTIEIDNANGVYTAVTVAVTVTDSGDKDDNGNKIYSLNVTFTCAEAVGKVDGPTFSGNLLQNSKYTESDTLTNCKIYEIEQDGYGATTKDTGNTMNVSYTRTIKGDILSFSAGSGGGESGGTTGQVINVNYAQKSSFEVWELAENLLAASKEDGSAVSDDEKTKAAKSITVTFTPTAGGSAVSCTLAKLSTEAQTLLGDYTVSLASSSVKFACTTATKQITVTNSITTVKNEFDAMITGYRYFKGIQTWNITNPSGGSKSGGYYNYTGKNNKNCAISLKEQINGKTIRYYLTRESLVEVTYPTTNTLRTSLSALITNAVKNVGTAKTYDVTSADLTGVANTVRITVTASQTTNGYTLTVEFDCKDVANSVYTSLYALTKTKAVSYTLYKNTNCSTPDIENKSVTGNVPYYEKKNNSYSKANQTASVTITPRQTGTLVSYAQSETYDGSAEATASKHDEAEDSLIQWTTLFETELNSYSYGQTSYSFTNGSSLTATITNFNPHETTVDSSWNLGSGNKIDGKYGKYYYRFDSVTIPSTVTSTESGTFKDYFKSIMAARAGAEEKETLYSSGTVSLDDMTSMQLTLTRGYSTSFLGKTYNDNYTLTAVFTTTYTDEDGTAKSIVYTDTSALQSVSNTNKNETCTWNGEYKIKYRSYKNIGSWTTPDTKYKTTFTGNKMDATSNTYTFGAATVTEVTS